MKNFSFDENNITMAYGKIIFMAVGLIFISIFVIGSINIANTYEKASINEEQMDKEVKSRIFQELELVKESITEKQESLNYTDILIKEPVKNEITPVQHTINPVEQTSFIEDKKKTDDLTVVFPTGYLNPDSLELAYLKGPNLNYTQNQDEHYKRNGYIAYDMVDTSGDHPNLYAPSYMYIDENGVMKDEERTYEASVVEQNGTTGLTVILSWNEIDNGNLHNMEWNIGHLYTTDIKDGDIVKTGDVIGRQGGCKGELKFNEASTGCHSHIEIRQGDAPLFYPKGKSLHGEALRRYKLYKEFKKNPDIRIATGDYADENFHEYKKFDNSKLLQVIHSLEQGQKVKNCPTSFKGARGCMQFMPGTFKAWACDGDNDGIADVDNISDSMCSANRFINHLKNLYETKHPGVDERHILFKTLYSYNAGYALADGKAIRINNNVSPREDNGIKRAVTYALDGINIYNSLNN